MYVAWKQNKIRPFFSLTTMNIFKKNNNEEKVIPSDKPIPETVCSSLAVDH